MADLVFMAIAGKIKDASYSCYDGACGSRVILMTEANSSMKSRVLKLLPKLKTNETDSLCVEPLSTKLMVVSST